MPARVSGTLRYPEECHTDPSPLSSLAHPAAAVAARGNVCPLDVADLGEQVLELLPGVAPWDALDDDLAGEQQEDEATG